MTPVLVAVGRNTRSVAGRINKSRSQEGEKEDWNIGMMEDCNSGKLENWNTGIMGES